MKSGPERLPLAPVDVWSVLVPPVAALWQRLERPGARATVIMAVRRALGDVGQWTGPDDAPAVLRDRLSCRLAEQGGALRVKDPVGWLLGAGLPRRGLCADLRCDDGANLVSGQPCQVCERTVADRRVVRRAIWRDVRICRPDADAQELRTAAEAAIREAVEHEEAMRQARWKQDAPRRRAQEEFVRVQRVAAQAAAEAEAARACVQCGAGRAAGLCQECADGRAVAAAGGAAVQAYLAANADFDDLDQVRGLANEAGRAFEVHVQRSVEQARERGAVPAVVSAVTRLAAEEWAGRFRGRALGAMACGKEARLEGEATYAMVMRSAHRYEDRAQAQDAARAAADRARRRTADAVLVQRMAVAARLLRPEHEVFEVVEEPRLLAVVPGGAAHAEGVTFRERYAARRRAREQATG